MWYTIIVKGREPPTEGKRNGLDELLDASSVRMGRKCLYNLPLSVANFFERNFKKPLDKPHKMCYNKGTKGEGKAVPKGKTHESQ